MELSINCLIFNDNKSIIDVKIDIANQAHLFFIQQLENIVNEVETQFNQNLITLEEARNQVRERYNPISAKAQLFYQLLADPVFTDEYFIVVSENNLKLNQRQNELIFEKFQ